MVDLELPETSYIALAKRSLWQRLFLLYAPVPIVGWVYHALYWAAVGSLSFLALLVALSLSLEPARPAGSWLQRDTRPGWPGGSARGRWAQSQVKPVQSIGG